MLSVFIELSLLLALTTLVTLIIKKLKQPLVVGYIISGIVAGPYFLNVLKAEDELELFSKVGIVFLLFIVGLYLSPKVIQEVGKVSLVTGLGQVFFTSVLGFLISLALGIDKLAALYVAIALTFSSTIIILKLISDKKDLQKLYAKIAVGFLLVQDIVATIILIFVTMSTSGGEQGLLVTLAYTLAKAGLILLFLFLTTRFILPKLVENTAQSAELLFLTALAWGMGLASLFAYLGFSIEIGALIAGVTLSVTPYSIEIASRLKPLRDFFIIIFFILLGSQLQVDNLGNLIFPALVLSLFVLIGNPIIVIILMNYLGFNRKTSYMAGLTVAQISEFSLILGALGLRVGHLTADVLSLITLVGLITIAGSTYLILYSERLYPKLTKFLIILELLKRKTTDPGSVGENYDSVIFGFDRVGHLFAGALKKLELSFLVVDFNPESRERVDLLGLDSRFGDAADIEFLTELPLQKPKLIISTIPDNATNVLITSHFRERNAKAIIIPLAHTKAEALELYRSGATYVLMPHYLGADFVAQLISTNGTRPDHYHSLRTKHQKSLLK